MEKVIFLHLLFRVHRKFFSDSSEILYVGTGRQIMHNDVPCDTRS